jgi:hypothetical protein
MTSLRALVAHDSRLASVIHHVRVHYVCMYSRCSACICRSGAYYGVPAQGWATSLAHEAGTGFKCGFAVWPPCPDSRHLAHLELVTATANSDDDHAPWGVIMELLRSTWRCQRGMLRVDLRVHDSGPMCGCHSPLGPGDGTGKCATAQCWTVGLLVDVMDVPERFRQVGKRQAASSPWLSPWGFPRWRGRVRGGESIQCRDIQ